MSDSIVDLLFPEIATAALFVVAIIGMIVLLYISTRW